MIDTVRILRTSAAWISILYVICFGAVALFPGIRELFVRYAFHTDMTFGENVITIGTFIAGFVLWNIITVLGVALFAILFNRMT